jgi:hypothetical protein
LLFHSISLGVNLFFAAKKCKRAAASFGRRIGDRGEREKPALRPPEKADQELQIA